MKMEKKIGKEENGSSEKKNRKKSSTPGKENHLGKQKRADIKVFSIGNKGVPPIERKKKNGKMLYYRLSIILVMQ
jgi:hypothetical protein